MGVLITLKPIRLSGEIVQRGEMMQTEDEERLISKGYARRLTREEARAILSEYADYADTLFNKKTI